MGERRLWGTYFYGDYKKFKVETSRQESNAQTNALPVNCIVCIS